MNWKLRLKNKTTLVALISGVVTFIYLILGWFGITPKVAQNDIMQAVTMLINILVLLGITVDPTTSGIGDSELAMGYEEPRNDNAPEGDGSQAED